MSLEVTLVLIPRYRYPKQHANTAPKKRCITIRIRPSLTSGNPKRRTALTSEACFMGSSRRCKTISLFRSRQAPTQQVRARRRPSLSDCRTAKKNRNSICPSCKFRISFKHIDRYNSRYNIIKSLAATLGHKEIGGLTMGKT